MACGSGCCDSIRSAPVTQLTSTLQPIQNDGNICRTSAKGSTISDVGSCQASCCGSPAKESSSIRSYGCRASIASCASDGSCCEAKATNVCESSEVIVSGKSCCLPNATIQATVDLCCAPEAVERSLTRPTVNDTCCPPAVPLRMKFESDMGNCICVGSTADSVCLPKPTTGRFVDKVDACCNKEISISSTEACCVDGKFEGELLYEKKSKNLSHTTKIIDTCDIEAGYTGKEHVVLSISGMVLAPKI